MFRFNFKFANCIAKCIGHLTELAKAICRQLCESEAGKQAFLLRFLSQLPNNIY